MNVLSLFDGMSCGQLALRKARVPYDRYFASEIEKDPMSITVSHFPETLQVGDVTKLDAFSLPPIDLLIGGSPCQGFCRLGTQLNFDDPRSKLFFEYVRLLRGLKPKYFLLENVRMKKEYQDIISEYLGVPPLLINSSLFVPQNRPRLYWTNIPVDLSQLPTASGKQLQDILLPEDHPDLPKLRLSESAVAYMGRMWNGKPRWKLYSNPVTGNAGCLNASMWKGVPYGAIKDRNRRLHPIECERLQGVPDDYTVGVSNTSRYKMLGNGWTVDVIAWLFSFINRKVYQ